MNFRITLEENPNRAICQTIPDYDIYLNGVKKGKLTYNMKGYIGYLPTPEGTMLDIGERSLSVYKKEISKLNKDAKLIKGV